MGEMYFGLGILDSPDFIEVSRPDLVGGVIGETEVKTRQYLEKAKGRVLFVDEAPDLYKADNERDFGRIALDIIMKFAEDHRDDTMIALAGYANGMNRLLSANPGLRSRFPTQLEFSSYSAEELGQIAAMFAENFRVLVHPGAAATFDRYTSWLTSTSTNNPENPAEMLVDIAGNGRYVRNVVSEAVERMKARIVSDPSIDLATADSDLLRTVVEADMTDALREVLISAGIQTREQG
ncbi:AAA+ family ATPase [Mycolicibacterium chubuense]|uniref:AAA family ATPase n=1 Tax=Mycolicibacterium chubuense TaxID=1800 RepID=UPI000D9A6E65|nr:AAA family ATPase [Mycolicibacterium chubuense]SPX90526.1 AAA+ family ATPase [Mycolicibacterium chubuense]